MTSGGEDALVGEQRISDVGRGETVAPAVEDLDRAELPVGPLALRGRAGHQGVERGGDRARARRPRRPESPRRGRSRGTGSPRSCRARWPPGPFEPIGQAHRRVSPKLARVVGEVARLAHVRERNRDRHVRLVRGHRRRRPASRRIAPIRSSSPPVRSRRASRPSIRTRPAAAASRSRPRAAPRAAGSARCTAGMRARAAHAGASRPSAARTPGTSGTSGNTSSQTRLPAASK